MFNRQVKQTHSAFARQRVTRRAILGGSLGLFALPLLQACAQEATPTPAAPSAAPTPAPAAATPAATPAAAAAATPAASPAAATTPATSPATTPAMTPAMTPAAATTPAPMAQIGGTVNVLAVWADDELESFQAMVEPFEQQTGVTVEYEGTRDLNAVLTTRVQGGNPPDLAGLPGPGQMAEFAQSGDLINLNQVLDMQTMQQQYPAQWMELAEANGQQAGIFIKAALKGLIWYKPPEFQQAGYQPTNSWTQLMDLSRRIAGTGTPPWSIGLESGAASGWPGTDWLENIILRQAGPDVYDEWWQGQARWTSSEIKEGWETWGEIVGDPQMVLGGRQGILATNFGDAANPLFTSPPQAYLHHQASFITGFITDANPNLQPVQDFNFFPFPNIDTQYADAAEVAGDLFGMFRDTPQARALMQWLVTPQAQEIWVRRGGAISPNSQVPMTAYPDDLSRQMAQAMVGAQIVKFDASDLMPEAMNNAFWQAILDFVNNPGDLNAILTRLDQVQADAYKE